jgi:RNA methyltransferase, TrmH family
VIGIRKLLSLPEGTRLRKYPRLLRLLEELLRSGRCPASAEFHHIDLHYFRELASSIADDAVVRKELQGDARTLSTLLKEAEVAMDSSGESSGRFSGEAFTQLLFTCNHLRHQLLLSTGAAPADWDLFPPLPSHLSSADAEKRQLLPIKLFLDGIRSPFNIGTIFRTAESFGVEEILIAPGGADPSHPRAQRSSMGCIASIPWSIVEGESCIELSNRQNLPLIAVETGGTDLNSFHFPPAGILLLGSEELGISPPLLDRARVSGMVVSVATGGLKGSINVAVAAGIVLHRWFSQYSDPNWD